LHAGITLEAVVADSAYGQIAKFRTGLEHLGLLYLLAVPYYVSARVTADGALESVAAIANGLAPSAWHQITWAHGTKGPLVARFAAIRVRPAKSRGERWLLCAESLTAGERKYYFSNCPPSASLRALVKLTRGRWAVEIQHRDLKSELGFDHFEGRSYPGWNHHAVLAAITYTFLQLERRRRTTPLRRFPRFGISCGSSWPRCFLPNAHSG
jgi:SRSO17 transposase